MARALPTEYAPTQLYQQFCADLAQAQSLGAVVDRCIAFMRTCFSPRSCGVAWDSADGPAPVSAITALTMMRIREDIGAF